MEQLTDEKIRKGLEVLKRDVGSKLLTHVNACVHCGLCAESCVYYNLNPDEHYVPAKKVDIVSSVYRRYNTFQGKIAPWLTNAKKLDEATIKDMVDLLYGSCTMCGRCNKHCSVGVDIEFLIRTGRAMLAEMGYVPETLQKTVDTAISTGNNMGIPTQEFIDTLKWLEEDLQFELDDNNASIPVDEKDKEIFYTLNPREPKFFPLSISAMAKVFYAANESWTISTKMYDVTNYAYFSGNLEEGRVIAKRMEDEMKSLDAKRCILAECGHGSRAFRWEAPNYLEKKLDFDVSTSVELLAEYIRDGRIEVDPEKNLETVTLHDPCNLARSGGIYEEQRYILRKCVKNFVEMAPHGTDNLCCGGGGGQLSMSEYNERRMGIAGLKAEQIKNTGAVVVATPCHNCVDQLIQTNAAYKLNVKIKTLAEIVADAIVLNNEKESIKEN
ncbi:MAG: (Fe-S)-binding protein [Bacteroidales bacterium]|nr:(Fe-S)-binding protein [Bacteroidales bacterium]